MDLNLIAVNPYAADQILQYLRYMPKYTKVFLPNFIHPMPSVTKLSDTIVLQNFLKFASVFNIVNLV